MVPKAFKEVKQQVDIVGKGRGDHGDSSWKGFAVFSRRTCHYRLCQVIYAHPSVNWLQVLGTTETPQIDQGVGHQFHPVVALLDVLKTEEQALAFVLPRKRPLDALP